MNAGRPEGRLLGWRSGGWVLLLGFVLILAVSFWRLLPMLGSPGSAQGDGRTVESYGFDLSELTVPREQLVAAGFPRDGLPALVDPAVMPGDAVEAFNETHRGKYLVSDDVVIGLEIEGEARAYPIRVMNWHEVINDTLGGRPVAVTFHPLCHSVVAFDRRLAQRVVEFGVSGLLYNSNLLLYDRTDGGGESLWSQLLGRAISGPAATEGLELERLPLELTRWDRWLSAHPETTVLSPDPQRLRRYQRDPYGNYLRTGKLRFPVAPLPETVPPELMQHMLVAQIDGERVVLPSDPEGNAALPSGGEVAWTVHSLWFAWYSLHPESARDELRSGA